MEITKSSKLVRRVIKPAIRGQNCPICFQNLHSQTSAILTSCNHIYCQTCIGKWSLLRRRCPLCNADFDSWLSPISLSAGTFRNHRLPALERQNPRNRTLRFGNDSQRRRSMPLPWRRSFGRRGCVGDDVIARRKLQWRESIYERRLKAVRLAPIDVLQQNLTVNSGVKERILGRIEPWIRRELQAILGDPDPSVIVRVASSLYVVMLEKFGFSSGEADIGEHFLEELRPFLLEKTDIFWHELRCFAESSFTMETYDSIVEYVS